MLGFSSPRHSLLGSSLSWAQCWASVGRSETPEADCFHVEAGRGPAGVPTKVLVLGGLNVSPVPVGQLPSPSLPCVS